jgi:hypothetical protein
LKGWGARKGRGGPKGLLYLEVGKKKGEKRKRKQEENKKREKSWLEPP